MISNISLFLVLLFVPIFWVACIDNPYRSVEKCDNQSKFVFQLWEPANCRAHCEKTYLFSSFEMNRVNKRVFKYQVNTLDKGKSFECCCKFNLAWPGIVRPNLVDRVHNAPQKMVKQFDCMPLGLTKIGLSRRTIDSYEQVCDYLEKKEPLTMLEALDFANLTKYLNMMQPKSPMILRTIQHKQMKRITKEVYESLKEALHDEDKVFLNSFKPTMDDFEGYELKAPTLRKIGNLLKHHLAEAMKIGIIGKAIDEYVLSYVVMDVAAAGKKVNRLNTELTIADHLLQGDYDQYNEESEKLAFKIDTDFNCKSLSQTQSKLDTYLAALKSTMSSLSTKLTYEHMSDVNPNLKFLQRSQKIYRLLEKVNCRRTPTRPVPIKRAGG